MAEKSVGRRATRRRSIEPGKIQAPGESVNGSGPDGLVASDKLRAYLECGILARGFAGVRCPDCGLERLVVFSCKACSACSLFMTRGAQLTNYSLHPN
jgi:hypothetical protein